MSILPKAILDSMQFLSMVSKVINGIFHRTRTNNFTISMEIQNNLEEPKQS